MTTCELTFKTGKIKINDDKCKDCKGCPCVKACSLFGKNLFKIQDGKPALIGDIKEFQRACLECLSCELMCQNYGNKGLKIELDMFGLDKYRRKKK